MTILKKGISLTVDTVVGVDFSTTDLVNGLGPAGISVRFSGDGCGGDAMSLDQWTDLDLTTGSSTCAAESTEDFFTQMSAGLLMIPDVCVLSLVMVGINNEVCEMLMTLFAVSALATAEFVSSSFCW